MFRQLALLAALAGTTDLGTGAAPDESLRRCVVATRLARTVGCSEDLVRDVQQVSLLGHLGCTAYAFETGAVWGDDVAVNHVAILAGPVSPPEALSNLVPLLAEATGRSRAAVVAKLFRPSQLGPAAPRATCEVAATAGRRLGCSPLAVASLGHVTAAWNGRGEPRVRGVQIPLPARLLHVALVAVMAAEGAGPEGAAAEVRRRAGGHLDPDLASSCAAEIDRLLEGLDRGDPFDTVLELEPDPVTRVGEAERLDLARVCGDLVDLKSPPMHGHSSAVADLAGKAAGMLGLREADDIRVAGHLHDVGRAALPSRLWSSPRRWSAAERDQARLHAYYSERVLARVPELAAVGTLAGLHHERCDGSGWHRGVHGDRIPLAARVLAAADAYRNLVEDRALRPGVPPAEASRRLRAAAASGALDHDAVAAVLSAAGASSSPPPRGAAGLTPRQIEVLGLVTRGLTNRQIARALVLSPRTVDRHVADVYERIGVSSRAAAALFCMEHGLLETSTPAPAEDG